MVKLFATNMYVPTVKKLATDKATSVTIPISRLVCLDTEDIIKESDRRSTPPLCFMTFPR